MSATKTDGLETRPVENARNAQDSDRTRQVLLYVQAQKINRYGK